VIVDLSNLKLQKARPKPSHLLYPPPTPLDAGRLSGNLRPNTFYLATMEVVTVCLVDQCEELLLYREGKHVLYYQTLAPF
jgi:hypothetical protein